MTSLNFLENCLQVSSLLENYLQVSSFLENCLQVYPNELESQPEFEGFSEWLQTFDLYRGKKSEEEFEDENRIVGKFKVN